MFEETTKQYSRNKKNFRKLNPSSSSFSLITNIFLFALPKVWLSMHRDVTKKNQIHPEITDLETNDIQR